MLLPTCQAVKCRDKTAALRETPAYRQPLYYKSPASELKDGARLPKSVTGSSAAPEDTVRGCGLQAHLLLEQLMPSTAAGKQLMARVGCVLEGAALESSRCTGAISIARTQVVILTEVPSKRLTGRLELAMHTAVAYQVRAEPAARSH